jgi:hypothetical protein
MITKITGMLNHLLDEEVRLLLGSSAVAGDLLLGSSVVAGDGNILERTMLPEPDGTNPVNATNPPSLR